MAGYANTMPATAARSLKQTVPDNPMEPVPPKDLLMNSNNLPDSHRGIRNAILNKRTFASPLLWITLTIPALSAYREQKLGVSGTF